MKRAMFTRLLLLLSLAIGCKSNLKVATKAAADCNALPNDPLCNSDNKLSIDGFQTEKAEVDSNGETLTVAWNNASILTTGTVALTTQADCSGQVFTYEIANGGSQSLEGVPDGIYYVCVRSNTNGKNFEALNNGELTVAVDRAAPVIEQLADIFTNTSVILAPKISDTTAVKRVWSVVTGAPLDFHQSDVVTSLTPTIEGFYTIRLTATDEVGRSSTMDVNLTYDISAPIVDAGLDKITNALFTQVAAVSIDTKTIEWSKISGPGDVAFGSPNTDTTTVAASADGDYVIRVTATDRAGNTGYDEFNLTWNTSGPIFVSMVAANDAVDGFINDAEKSLATDLFTLNAVSYTTATYSTSVAASTVCDASVTYSSPTMPQPADILGDGTWVFCVKIVDAASNTVYGKSATIVRDIAAPIFTSLLGANGASDGYINATEVAATTPLLSLTASGYSSAAFTVVLTDSALTCDASQTYSQSSIPTVNTIPAMDGAYAVCAKLSDSAGNIIYARSQQIVRDISPPTVSVGADIAISAPTTINAVTTGAVTYTWTKTSGTGTVSFSNPNSEDTDFSAPSDGIYVVRLTVADPAGNSAYDELSIDWDQTPPVFTSLARANDAIDGYINDAEKNGSTALWTLTASGYTSVAYTQALDDSTPVTCDISKTYSQSSIARATDLTSGDVPYVLCVKLTDNAGNITYGKSAIVTRDISVPTVNVGADVLANTLVNIDATTSGATIYSWTKQSGAGVITFGTASAEDSTVSAVGDYAYVLRLTVADVAGNSAYDELIFTWDSTAPVFTSLVHTGAASDGYINDSEKSGVTALWVETSSGANTVNYSPPLDNTTPVTCDSSQTYSESTIATAADLPNSDKPYIICERLQDTVGNTTYGKSDVIIRDTTAPTVNVGSDVSVNAMYSANATTSGASTYQWTKQSGGGTITFGTPTSEDTTILASTDGIYVIRLTVTDAAGNSAYGDLNFTWQTSGPLVSSFIGINAAADGYLNASEIGSGATLLQLTATGYNTVNYTNVLPNAGLICDVSQTYGNATIPVITDVPAIDGAYAVCVVLEDVATNKTYAKSQVITRDIAAPTVNVGSDVVVNANHNINAATSGAATYAWTKQSGPGTITFGSATSEDTTAQADTEGLYVLRLTVTDAAGNTAFDELDFTWDVTAPTFTSLTLTGDGADGYVNDNEKANTSALWALTAANYAAINYTTALDNTVAVTCDGSKVYSQSSIARATDLPASDKPYVICAKLVDTAGNITYGKSAVVTRDISYPTFTSLVGINGAIDGYINNAEKTSGAPLLALTAAGQSSTNYTLVLADSALTCDVSQTYGQSSIPVITGIPGADGAYAVCVKLVDVAGNITYGKSQQIVRDTNAPTVNAGPDIVTNTTTSINATTGGNPTTYAWTKQSGAGTVTFGTPSAEDTTAYASTETTFVLRLTVTDAAGNSNYDELNFTWDVTAPVFTSLVGTNEASDSYINLAEIGSTSAIVALTASNYVTADYTAILDETPSQTCNAAKTYSNSAIPAINTMTASDDQYVVCVRLTDAAGNITYGKSSIITRDVAPPTVNAGPDLAANSTTMINATTGGSPVSYAWTKQSGTGTVTFGTPNAEDTTVSANTESTFVLRLTVTDAAGNSAYDEMNFTWDVTGPTFTSLNRTGDAADGYVNNAEKNNTTALWTLSASGAASTNYTVAINDSPPITCNGSYTYDQSTPRRAVDLGSDLPYAICVKLVDAVGNVTYGKSQQVIRDIIAPTVNAGTDKISNASGISIDATVTLSPTTFAWTKTSGPGTVTFSSTNTEDTTITAITVDGVYVLRLTATDAAGNSAYDEMSLTWDTVAPIATIASGTPSPSINDAESVSLTIAGTGVTQYKYKIGLNATTDCSSATGYSASNVIASPANYSIPSSTSDGLMIACVVGRDAALNWQPYASATTATWTKVAKTKAVIDVVSGEISSCALFANGRVKCWGAAYEGRLGSNGPYGNTGSTVGDDIPYVNLGTGKKAIKIFAGNKHVCVILQDHNLKCWGRNSEAQLGLGDLNNRGANANEMGDNLPVVNVGTGRTVIDGAAGDFHTCVILDNHSVKCWGSNTIGQLGQGNTTTLGDDANEMGDNLAVVDLGTNVKALSLTANAYQTCAILDDHSLKCWGNNYYEQLGSSNAGSGQRRGDAAGEMGNSLPAVSLGAGRFALQVAVSVNHTCALLDNHQIKCWGEGINGKLGNGTTASINAASIAASATVDLGTGRSAVQIAGGGHNTCALLDNSTIKCWGKNDVGQAGQGHANSIGDGAGEMGDNLAAIDLGTGHFAVKVTSYNAHVCAILDDSNIKCWGGNAYGQLGLGHTNHLGDGPNEMGDNLAEVSLSPNGGRAVLSVAAREYSTCAILDDHSLKCWGANGIGKLGYGDTTNRGTAAGNMGANLPAIDLGTGRKALQVTAGTTHTCALLDDRSLKCWGSNDSGQLGQGHTADLGDGPNEMGDNLNPIPLGKKVMSVAAAYTSTCVILDDSSVKCWGENNQGQLGYGDTVNRGGNAGDIAALPPVSLGTGKTAVQIIGGWLNHCAVLQDSTVKCWGSNGDGQLGQGNTINLGDGAGEMGDSLAAINLGTNRKVISMPNFYYTPCALLDDNSVKCWGRNTYASLADGSRTDKGGNANEMGDSLAAIGIGATISSVAPGYSAIAAITTASITKAWGSNTGGLLGYGVAGGSYIGDSVAEVGANTPVIDLGTNRFLTQVSAGTYFFCGITDMALAKCWGANNYGQLGQGHTATLGDNSNELGDYLPFISLW